MRFGIGIATGISLGTVAAVVGAGAAVGGVALAASRKPPSAQGPKVTALQTQLTTASQQIQADQTAIAQVQKSQKTWEYVAIGGGVLIVMGGIVYFVNRKR